MYAMPRFGFQSIFKEINRHLEIYHGAKDSFQM
jgi:hypothetical protein